MKICLACSAGGHLDEILQLRPFFSKHKYFFISFRRADTESLVKKEKIYFLERPARNPITTIIDFFRALKILQNENGTIFQADLMEKLETGKVGITRLLDKLEAKQLIERKRRGMTNIVILK